MNARIAGTGHYLPGEPITNEELIQRHQLRIKPYFIRESIGVETRHFAAPDQATSDLATEAAVRAIEASDIPRRSIRRVILATLQQLGGDKRRTAEVLGISLKTIYNRLNVYEAAGHPSPEGEPTF